MITKKINFTEQQIEQIHLITEEPEFGAAVRKLCALAVKSSGHDWQPITRRGQYDRAKPSTSAQLAKPTFEFGNQWCDAYTGEWFTSAMDTKEDAYRILPNPAARSLFDLNCLEGDSILKSLTRVLKQVADLYDDK